MSKHKSPLLLIGLTYISFISLGLPDGLLGVAWPSIRVFFGLPIDALGALLVMFTAGYLLASFSSGWLLARMNVGTLLAGSCFATAMCLFVYAITPVWLIVIAFGLAAGLGAGAIDAGLNTYAANHFSARSVNWLHACYGLGATLGPLIMTTVLAAGRRWQMGYVIVGSAQLVLAMCFGVTRRLWSNKSEVGLAREDPSSIKTSPSASPTSPATTMQLPIVWLSIAIFFVYTGIEAAAGAWAYSLFTEGRAVPAMTAGAWVSVYWGAFTAGRIIAGFVIGLLPRRLFLRCCIIGMIGGALLMWMNVTTLLSFIGLAIMGLFAAPIFPSLIASTPERLGERHTANGVGFQIAAAVLGQSLLPGLIGVLARNFGWEIVAPALLIAAILLLFLYENLASTHIQANVSEIAL
jgi:fucose permease